MARAKRICPKPGCPKPVANRYCTEHDREYEAKRGTPQQRGYGSKHRLLRKQWGERVATGTVRCPSCSQTIKPDEPWDLGHTDDRTGYIGPQHSLCNRSEGGKRGREVQA